MTELLLSALVAGLAGSPHCVGMCGGFAGVCSRSARGAAAWHAGRLSTYAGLGAIGGYAGSLLRGPAWLAFVVSALLLTYFAGVLAGILPQPHLPLGRVGRWGRTLIARGDVASRYIFGMVTGLLPCGLVYATLSLAIVSRTPWSGSLVMLAFGAGTVPALAALSGVMHRLLARGIWVRRVLALLVLLAGMWSLAMRVEHDHSAAPERETEPHVHSSVS